MRNSASITKASQPDNPRLIYCSVTGFGQDGPYAPRAGYDLMIQGMGGIMSITGEPSGPMRLGVAFADVFTGVYSALAIQAALVQRARTGKGCYIDMALLDTQVGVLANQALFYLVVRQGPGAARQCACDRRALSGVSGVGRPHHHCLRQRQPICPPRGAARRRLRSAEEPDFKTNAGRVTHRDRLIPRMLPLTQKFTRDDLLAKLEAAGVPGGPINDLADVFADPQVHPSRHAHRPARSRRRKAARSPACARRS